MTESSKKVFISWSKHLSEQVAFVWKDLLSEIFQNVDPFMSNDSIGPGERSLTRIADELEGSVFGIIVVTQENQAEQWLNYEAGALSKNVSNPQTRVAPCLVDIPRKGDVTGPIGQFHASLLDKDGVQSILTEIAKAVEADETRVMKLFERAWVGEYEERFRKARTDSRPPQQSERKMEDVLDEILTINRTLLARLSNSDYPEPETFSSREIASDIRRLLAANGIEPDSVRVGSRLNGRPHISVVLSSDVPQGLVKRLRSEISEMTMSTVVIKSAPPAKFVVGD